MDKLSELLSDMVACDSSKGRADIAVEIEKFVNNLTKQDDAKGRVLEPVYAPIVKPAEQQMIDGICEIIRREIHRIATED